MADLSNFLKPDPRKPDSVLSYPYMSPPFKKFRAKSHLLLKNQWVLLELDRVTLPWGNFVMKNKQKNTLLSLC